MYIHLINLYIKNYFSVINKQVLLLTQRAKAKKNSEHVIIVTYIKLETEAHINSAYNKELIITCV